jgi:CxxC-x17-CxxC domain-containing protein
MSRIDIPEEKRRDFYLYVDEFQNFATDSFVNILSEARKYRLVLTLANQYIAQLEEMTPSGKSTKVRDAVFGNIGTLVVFRVGAGDAEYLEKEFVPDLTAEDLVNLQKYHIFLKLMIDGVAGRPFSAQTFPPFSEPEESNREKIIRSSRERYGMSQKVVEDKIIRWTMLQKSTPPPVQQKLYDAQCSICGKKTKVVFPPDGIRPVYCKSCLKKIDQEKKPLPKETITLKEVPEKEPLSFSGTPKREKKKVKRKKKEVDIKELKKALEKALKKNK